MRIFQLLVLDTTRGWRVPAKHQQDELLHIAYLQQLFLLRCQTSKSFLLFLLLLFLLPQSFLKDKTTFWLLRLRYRRIDTAKIIVAFHDKETQDFQQVDQEKVLESLGVLDIWPNHQHWGCRHIETGRKVWGKGAILSNQNWYLRWGVTFLATIWIGGKSNDALLHEGQNRKIHWIYGTGKYTEFNLSKTQINGEGLRY